MTAKRVLLVVGAVICLAGGFAAAEYLGRLRYGQQAEMSRVRHEVELTALRAAAEKWTEAVASAQGEAVLRAFVAGISPALLADHRENLEMAAVSLLRVPGVAGIHLLGPNDEILYSSDAKLATTGDVGPRGMRASEVVELVTRPSSRAGVLDIALPIAKVDRTVAVAWLEYDVAAVRDALRPAELPRTAPSEGLAAGDEAASTTPVVAP